MFMRARRRDLETRIIGEGSICLERGRVWAFIRSLRSDDFTADRIARTAWKRAYDKAFDVDRLGAQSGRKHGISAQQSMTRT
jgi:hypothetical protein